MGLRVLFTKERGPLKGTQHAAKWVNKFQAEKTMEIQLVRPTEVCGKV